MKYIFTIFFSLLTSFCYSQKANKYSIYVGKVEGLKKKQFINTLDEYDLRSDSLLQIGSIVKSKYPIEIRLYESTGVMAVRSCTKLYFDSSFHVSRVLKTYNGWEKEYHAEAHHPVENINADSAFRELVKNGIFSLPEYGGSNSARKVLTPNGFTKDVGLCGALDGYSYNIQIKVYDIYKTIYSSNSLEAELNCYPDNDIIRRKKNIVLQLEATPHLKKNSD